MSTRTNTVMPAALAEWHRIVNERQPQGLHTLLADDVVFWSPVVHTPQRGKAITQAYLTAALHVLGTEHFRYLREVVGTDGVCGAVLEFETELTGIKVNGVDMIQWNDQGQITDFKVMVRPLKAVQAVHEQMGRLLAEMGGKHSA